MPTNTLAMMTAVELRQLAATMGIRQVNELKKQQLISALVHRKAGPVPPVFSQERPFATSSSTVAVMVQQSAPSTYPAPAPPPVGLPIPNQYGTTRLVLMVQDPHRLFAYWMVNDAQLADVQQAYQQGCHPVLLLMSNGGIEQREIELRSGNAYLAVVPKCSYKAALALRDVDGELHHLISSNRITMPSDSIGPESVATETDPHDQFHELYELAAMRTRVSTGSSSDRLEDRDSGRTRPAGILPLGTSSTSLIRK
jgi:hypothetical protein